MSCYLCPVYVVARPHPAQALGGCNALPVSGGAVLVPGLICCFGTRNLAGKVYDDDDL
jgi:hypothetical protein